MEQHANRNCIFLCKVIRMPSAEHFIPFPKRRKRQADIWMQQPAWNDVHACHMVRRKTGFNEAPEAG
eukprot:338558-Pelagomonas_calceolata.AAC.2